MREAVRRFLSHDCGPFAQFVKYGAIGVAATCVQFAVFYALASTCLRCLTADDTAVRLLGLPGAEFTGAEPWYASRWFLAGVATAVGFVFANIFCWLMNGWGTDPAERAFYRAFRDFNPLNDLGIG